LTSLIESVLAKELYRKMKHRVGLLGHPHPLDEAQNVVEHRFGRILPDEYENDPVDGFEVN